MNGTVAWAVARGMLGRNSRGDDQIDSMRLTATDDLTAEYPAAAARALGLGDVPLPCARELGIEHGKHRCIRVLMHLQLERDRSTLHHVYLEGARTLRDDLPE